MNHELIDDGFVQRMRQIFDEPILVKKDIIDILGKGKKKFDIDKKKELEEKYKHLIITSKSLLALQIVYQNPNLTIEQARRLVIDVKEFKEKVANGEIKT